MIWNKNLLYQISDVWYHITKLYLVNNEKNYKIKLNHFFTNGAPGEPTARRVVHTLKILKNLNIDDSADILAWS